MRKLIAVWFCFVGVGCAPARVSLRQVQEYDAAVRLAESRGLQTPEMYAKLSEMVKAYVSAPGEDVYDKAVRDSARAASFQAAAAVYAVTKPVYQPQPPPLTFNQWRNGR